MSKNTDLGNLVNGLFVDSSSRVGIGTTSPLSSQKLTVIMNNNTNGTGVAIRALNDGGTASQPALSFVNGSGNNIAQIVGDNGTGYLAFNTGTSNTERMRITSAGNVGIGTTNPTTAGGGYTGLDIRGTTGSSLILGSTTTPCGYLYASASFLSFETSSTIPILFNPGGTERVRFASSGDIYQQFGGNRRWGMDLDTTGIYFYGLASNSNGRALRVVAAAQDALEGIFFQTGTSFTNATTKMTISAGGNIGAPSGTNIYNASDARLKRNINTIEGGLNKVMALNPVKFNWIENYEPSEEGKDMLGFIAQEVLLAVPEAVENFASNKVIVNGKEIDDVLRVNEKFIIPVLVKAIQELKTEIEILKQK